MIITANFAFDASTTKPFCAVVKITAPMKNGKVDNSFISPNDFVAHHGRVETLGNENYWVGEELIQSTSWSELDQLVENRVQEIRSYRKWALETLFSVPPPKKFVVV